MLGRPEWPLFWGVGVGEQERWALKVGKISMVAIILTNAISSLPSTVCSVQLWSSKVRKVVEDGQATSMQ